MQRCCMRHHVSPGTVLLSAAVTGYICSVAKAQQKTQNINIAAQLVAGARLAT